MMTVIRRNFTKFCMLSFEQLNLTVSNVESYSLSLSRFYCYKQSLLLLCRRIKLSDALCKLKKSKSNQLNKSDSEVWWQYLEFNTDISFVLGATPVADPPLGVASNQRNSKMQQHCYKETCAGADIMYQYDFGASLCDPRTIARIPAKKHARHCLSRIQCKSQYDRVEMK